MALFTFESYFGSSETSNSLISKFLSFLNVCPKVAFLDTPQIAFFAFKIHTGECILHLFGLYVPKLYFHLNLKWHCLHLKSISDPLKPLCLISNFLLLCPKVVFLDKPKVAFFAFKICTGEYVHCSFGLYVPKLYFHLNLKLHCLHLKGI